MGDPMSERRRLAVLLINVVWVEIAGNTGEEIDIRLANGLRKLGLQPDRDILNRGSLDHCSTPTSSAPPAHHAPGHQIGSSGPTRAGGIVGTALRPRVVQGRPNWHMGWEMGVGGSCTRNYAVRQDRTRRRKRILRFHDEPGGGGAELVHGKLDRG